MHVLNILFRFYEQTASEPAIEIPEDLTKWSSAEKKILPVLPNKFRASNQLLGEEGRMTATTRPRRNKRMTVPGDPLDDQFEGQRTKSSQGRPSQGQTAPTSFADVHGVPQVVVGWEDRRWMRERGITDSTSSLNSSESPPSFELHVETSSGPDPLGERAGGGRVCGGRGGAEHRDPGPHSLRTNQGSPGERRTGGGVRGTRHPRNATQGHGADQVSHR
ncbi:hypothetical protein CEXT_534541 [Caerostris extrusa]|uniref:Uncharacterized protein n=1 Tax=Caerostris extrusa TaxID=172846 RepID=A0AAV4XYR3_CAEEX|nr:hypothetical protein CEXT_534541 [Caerostris extrusa]